MSMNSHIGRTEAEPVDLDALVSSCKSQADRVEMANRAMQLREMLWRDSEKGYPTATVLISTLEVIAEKKEERAERGSGGLALFARRTPKRPVWASAARQSFSLMASYLRSRTAAKRGYTSPSIDDLIDLTINACVLGWLWAGRGKRLTEQDVLFAAAKLCSGLTLGHRAEPA